MGSNKIVIILVAIGILCLGLSLYLTTRTDSSFFSQKSLATLSNGSGQVAVFRKNMTTKEMLTQKVFLYSLDSVETSADGDAMMEFDSGYRIHVPENVLLTLSQEREKITILLKRGDVQVENYGQDETLFISKDGARWKPNEYELVHKARRGDQSLPDSSTGSAETNIPAPQMKEGLSPDYIQDMMRSQRQNFFKCYTQLLQKTPGLTGQASISFIIETSGKVSQAEVSSTNIQDINFKKCLIEAVKRVEFKSFSGEALSTVFPLKFE